MTTISNSNVPTGVTTPMHIAVPQASAREKHAYRAPFGLAAVVLSLLGVSMAYEVKPEDTAVTEQQTSTVNREASADEWDNWKSMRDLA